MTITEKEFRNAKPGDQIIDARGDVITIIKKQGGSFSTVIVDNNDLDKLHFFEGSIVDGEFAIDVYINHPKAQLISK